MVSFMFLISDEQSESVEFFKVNIGSVTDLRAAFKIVQCYLQY